MPTKARKFTTNKKLTVNLCLPDFSAMKIVTWEIIVGGSSEICYDMVLGRYLLMDLFIDIKFSKHTIGGGKRP